jgi:hypothetical protein
MAKRWRFICSTEPTSIVVVHDPQSAEVLNRVLRGELKGPWSMQVEEERTPTIKPARPRAVAPVEPPAEAPIEAAVEAPVALPPGSEGSGAALRKHKRYQLRLYVALTNGLNTFSSKTRDISLGGLALEEKLPAFFFGQYCRIQIYKSTDAGRIDLRCKIFADPRNPRRVQFIDPPPETIQRLQEWMDLLEREADKTEVA